MSELNKPYVKVFKDGILTNPITSYINNLPNRKQRRGFMNEPRAFNNSSNFQMTASGRFKWHKRKQVIDMGNGKFKTIHHLDYAS